MNRGSQNLGWNQAEGDTGVAPIDATIKKTLAFEQSHLGNPIVQFALLGFAAYGIYHLATKMMKKA